jgi:uncharacterized protein (TIGR03067 family)
MRRKTDISKLGFALVLAVAAGCAAPHKSDSSNLQSPPPESATGQATSDAAALQGTWKGQAVGANPEASVSLVLSGANLEFHGESSNDWCKGTFSLREDTHPKQLIGVITDAPDPQVVGKEVNAIYKLEDGVLTIAGNAPGTPTPPAAFDAPDARQLVLKAEKP